MGLVTILALEDRQPRRSSPARITEAHTSEDIKAKAHPLLFVRGDAIAPAGRDILQAEKLAERRSEQHATLLADIRSSILSHGMQVAADLAELGFSQRDPLTWVIGLDIAYRQYRLIDDVARALVIDDGRAVRTRRSPEIAAAIEIHLGRPAAAAGQE